MAIYERAIVGVTPLLLHNPASMRPSEEAKAGTRTKKDIPTPEVEAEQATYRNKAGDLCVPALGIQRCILEASKQFKDPENKRFSIWKRMAAALYPPEEELFPIANGNGKLVKDYEIDVRRAVVQKQGIMRARPKIVLPWSVTARFEYDDEVLGANFIDASLELGGKTIGICDFRPQKGGPYGRFRLED